MFHFRVINDDLFICIVSVLWAILFLLCGTQMPTTDMPFVKTGNVCNRSSWLEKGNVTN